MSHIFISYSTKNSEYAYKLADKLREEGFNVWIDNAELRASDNWWESIVKALRAADAFIVIMSPASRASDWVQRELTLADEWKKPAFPLLLEGEKFEIYVLTQFKNVKDGSLPPQSFYDDLARYVKRENSQGKNILEQSGDFSLSGLDIQAIENDVKAEINSRLELEKLAETSPFTAIVSGKMYRLPIYNSRYLLLSMGENIKVSPISYIKYANKPSWVYIKTNSEMGNLEGWLPANQIKIISKAGKPVSISNLALSRLENIEIRDLLKIQNISPRLAWLGILLLSLGLGICSLSVYLLASDAWIIRVGTVAVDNFVGASLGLVAATVFAIFYNFILMPTPKIDSAYLQNIIQERYAEMAAD